MTDTALATDTGNPPAADPQGTESQTLDDGLLDGAQGEPGGDLLSGDEATGYEGVPEKYVFTPPEGVEVNDEIQVALDAFSGFAREINLDQNQYQKLIEYDAQRAAQLEGEAAEEWNSRVTGWREASTKDQEIGGAHQKESLAHAHAALKKFGTPGLAELLKSPSEKNPNGLAIGNHPEVLRLLSRVGKALGDPTPVDGDEKLGQPDPLDRLYPTMKAPKT